MAVARHNKVANRMPIHIEGAVAPAAACPAKVSHRKAPGAISAIAFIVRPVKPTVDFISTGFSAISVLLKFCHLPQSFRASSITVRSQPGPHVQVLLTGTTGAGARRTLAARVGFVPFFLRLAQLLHRTQDRQSVV